MRESHEIIYRVVVNDQEQDPVWPEHRGGAQGWTATECLPRIEGAWTDTRPRSLRERMAAARLSAR